EDSSSHSSFIHPHIFSQTPSNKLSIIDQTQRIYNAQKRIKNSLTIIDARKVGAVELINTTVGIISPLSFKLCGHRIFHPVQRPWDIFIGHMPASLSTNRICQAPALQGVETASNGTPCKTFDFG